MKDSQCKYIENEYYCMGNDCFFYVNRNGKCSFNLDGKCCHAIARDEQYKEIEDERDN